MSIVDELRMKQPKHPVKALLKENGIKVSRTAEVLGVSMSHLNNVLNGYVRPSEWLEDKLEDIRIELEHRYFAP